MMDENDDGERGSGKPLSRAQKKMRVTMYVEPAILESFREQAMNRGTGYQTLMNEALRHSVRPESAPLTVKTLRDVLREEIGRHFSEE